MNQMPGPPHMQPNYRNQPSRRQNDYPYPPAGHQHHHHLHHQPQLHPPPHLAYTGYVHPSQYHASPMPIPLPHYPQYFPQYAQYGPPPFRPYPQQQPQQQQQQHQQQPLIVSSHPHAQPVVPATRHLPQYQPQQAPQPHRTPQPSEVLTPSTISQNIASPSTTPTTTSVITTTPPVASAPKPNPPAPAATIIAASPTPAPAQRVPFSPKLPWFSVPEAEFPAKVPRRRRRRKPTELSANEVELPSRSQGDALADIDEVPQSITSPDATAVEEQSLPLSLPPPVIASAESAALIHSENVPSATLSPAAYAHKRTTTKPVVPVVPIIPVSKAPPRSSKHSPSTEIVSSPLDPSKAPEPKSEDAAASPSVANNTEPLSPPIKPPPKSWAELLRSRAPAANGATTGSPSGSVLGTNGAAASKAHSLADLLRLYNVENGSKLSFLEPRGLVNTGNTCYMNSILQVLVFCIPFYEFLDQVSKRVAHSFKGETPLVEALIMFMREYNVIDSAVSVEQLRLRLKDNELEQYGEAFIPEYVYDVIKSLPRFSTMRRGHQQDAEEFLGFLLEGLHDECVHVMRKAGSDAGSMKSSEPPASPMSEKSEPQLAVENGWMEVGPKQKASVTRSSGVTDTDSPITKIFGGKLRSVLRVPGLKDSVTLTPYRPLQLDIGAPNIVNITDALKGLTRPETLQGEFNSPRGPGTTATKQVFIETLPPVLILHLKRFQYDNAGGTQKIWKKVGYPLDLEIPKEVLPQQQRAALSMRPGGLPKYRLIAVVYHHGKNASGGHYTVDVRRQEGREWMRVDDTYIRRIRSEDVASEGSEEDPKILAKALEQHKRDSDSGSSIYKTSGFGSLNDEEDGNDDDEDSKGAWSQVNGHATSPTISANTGKKWSTVANGTTSPKSSMSGKQTPRGGAGSKSSVKDNKVAYILFYQQITT